MTGRIYTSHADGTAKELWPSHFRSHADEIDFLTGRAVPAVKCKDTYANAAFALTALLDAGRSDLFDLAIETAKRWHMEEAGERNEEARG